MGQARSELALAINPSELSQFKDCKTSRDFWLKLHKVYESTSPARKASLLKQLLMKKMSPNEDVREFLKHFLILLTNYMKLGLT